MCLKNLHKDITTHLLVVLILLSFNNVNSQNILIDGDFESNSPWYVIDGQGYNQSLFGLLSYPGDYAVVNNTTDVNFFFIHGGDHTTGNGNMLVIEGNTTPGQQSFFKPFNASNGICDLIPGNTYIFTYWIKSVSLESADAATLANIGISISNADAITLVNGDPVAPLPASGWQRVSYSFIPTNTCVNISLWNNNYNATGNDFAIDDVALTPKFSVTYSLSYDPCISSSTSLLTIYSNGTQQRTYEVTGPLNMKNMTGTFDLPSGDYTLIVTDSYGETITKNFTVSVPDPHLFVGNDQGICIPDSITLNASNGTGYEWSAVPSDPTLTSPTNTSITVSPIQNTKYTVKTNPPVAGSNLIFNGDFSMGNIGFFSRYAFRTTDANNTPQSYGVTSNPSSWNTTFLPCGDHTSGTGMMLVANGVTNNYETNAQVWGQVVPVSGMTDYTFSFWVQSLTPVNLSRFQVMVNGSVINIQPTATVAAICGNWTKFSFSFTTMGIFDKTSIEIRDSEYYDAGNDFAIDDIELVRDEPCNIIDSVTVYAKNTQAPSYSVIQPICGNSGSIKITTVALQYSFDNGVTWQNHPFKENLGPGTYILKVKNNNLCVSDPVTVTLKAIPTLRAPQFSIVQPECLASYYLSFIEINENGVEYSFDGGITWSTNPKLQSLQPQHTYQLMYKNQQGCVSDIMNTTTIQVYPSPPAPSVTVTQPSDCTQPTGSIQITSNAYKYSFDNGITWGTNLNSGQLIPGTYNVMALSQKGCESEPTTVVINPPAGGPPAPVITIVNPTCTVPTGTITVNDVAPYYSFDNGTTWVSGSVSNPLLPGTYLIKTKNSDGCESPVTQAIIDNTGKPSLPVLSLIQPDCLTATGTITITSSAEEFSFDNGITWISQNTLSGLAEGEYLIRVKNIYNCISDAITVNITKTVVPLPETNDIIFCQNNPAQALAATGTNLLWYVQAIGGAGSLASPIPDTTIPGTIIYYVSQTINGCESERSALSVVIESIPLAPQVSTPAKFCEGNISIPLTANGKNLLWYTQAVGGTGNSTPPIPSTDSTYYVSQTSNNGCESPRSEINVIINSIPAPPVVQTPIVYKHYEKTTPLSATGNNLKWYNEDLEKITKLPITPKSDEIGQTKYYVIQVIDGCESEMAEIIVEIVPDYMTIEYPKFFTPNGDGINETWNIATPQHGLQCSIIIFDRYGKVIEGLTAPGIGWDGTFKGKPLPATDYWFKVIYTEYGIEKEYESHFSLIR